MCEVAVISSSQDLLVCQEDPDQVGPSKRSAPASSQAASTLIHCSSEVLFVSAAGN